MGQLHALQSAAGSAKYVWIRIFSRAHRGSSIQSSFWTSVEVWVLYWITVTICRSLINRRMYLNQSNPQQENPKQRRWTDGNANSWKPEINYAVDRSTVFLMILKKNSDIPSRWRIWHPLKKAGYHRNRRWTPWFSPFTAVFLVTAVVVVFVMCVLFIDMSYTYWIPLQIKFTDTTTSWSILYDTQKEFTMNWRGVLDTHAIHLGVIVHFLKHRLMRRKWKFVVMSLMWLIFLFRRVRAQRLSHFGQQQASSISLNSSECVDLVVSSPLTRTLQTASAIYSTKKMASICNVLPDYVVLEDARECYDVHQCDQRHDARILKRNFPHFDFSSFNLRDNKSSDHDTTTSGVGGQDLVAAEDFPVPQELESPDHLVQRAYAVARFLCNTPPEKQRIALISHSTFLLALFNGVFYPKDGCTSLLDSFNTVERRAVLLACP